MRVKSCLFLALLLVALIPNLLFSQYYFGKNKIQYSEYNWQQFETEHYNIYFYQQELEIATVTARLAEQFYDQHAINFEYVLPRKIPLIIYSSFNLFQETNTVPYILPEGVGGFTEYYKGRVVIPYNGSYEDFRHTLKHELVHVFTLYKLQSVLDSHRDFFFEFFPLWFMEGIAEHWSEKSSLEMEMIVRSAILQDSFRPVYDREIAGSYLMYKGAESFLNFLEMRYGEGKLILLYENWWKGKDFYKIFKEVYGVSLEEANEQWRYHLVKKYYPLINTGKLPGMLEVKLTKEGVNVAPCVYRKDDSSSTIYYKSNFMGYTGIYSLNDAGEKRELIKKGGLSEPLESLHLFESKISINNDGLLAYTGKYKGGDVLYKYDTKERKVVLSTKLEGIPSLRSPAVSPSGNKIVVSGIGLSGNKNLYLYDSKKDSISQLTGGLYNDRSPVWYKDDSSIIFVSDRCLKGREGNTSLYRYDLQKEEVYHFDLPTGKVRTPAVNKFNDDITFTAAFDDFFSIYILRSGSLFKAPRILTGAFEPVWYNKDTLVTSIFTNESYQLFKFPVGDSLLEFKERIDEQLSQKNWSPQTMEITHQKGYSSYSPNLTLDLAQGRVATSAGVQTGGGIEGKLSDILGHHQLYFTFSNNATELDEVLEKTNAFVGYYNPESQPNWGVGGYHLNEYNYAQDGRYFREENLGGFVQVSHPLSRFHRVEGRVYTEWSKRYFSLWREDPDRAGLLSAFNLSYIRDATLWGNTGPIQGMRANLTVGLKGSVPQLELYNWLASADLRYYLRVSQQTTLAFRTIGRVSQGKEPQRFFMGGSWTFRGYPYNNFVGKKLFLVNNEYRFPLINRFNLKLPFLNVDIRGIRGAAFFDTGEAWGERSKFDLNGSYGFGARINLGGYTVLRFDLTKITDFHSKDSPFRFSFFYGWNY